MLLPEAKLTGLDPSAIWFEASTVVPFGKLILKTLYLLLEIIVLYSQKGTGGKTRSDICFPKFSLSCWILPNFLLQVNFFTSVEKSVYS